MTNPRVGGIALLATACFVAGWLLGRDDDPPPPTPPAAPAPPASASSGLTLRIDAGAINLLPDASLELKPMPYPDAGAGFLQDRE